MVKAPRKIAMVAAAIHLLVVAVFAIWIYVANSHDGESPMYWLFLMFGDVPASLLLKPLGFIVDGWPRVSWLPGLAGDWPNFLYPLFFFAIVGTLWWYCIGWVCGRGWTLIFGRSKRVPPTI
jgi:hypothetical protein